jgi:hypothetical protein
LFLQFFNVECIILDRSGSGVRGCVTRSGKRERKGGSKLGADSVKRTCRLFEEHFSVSRCCGCQETGVALLEEAGVAFL